MIPGSEQDAFGTGAAGIRARRARLQRKGDQRRQRVIREDRLLGLQLVQAIQRGELVGRQAGRAADQGGGAVNAQRLDRVETRRLAEIDGHVERRRLRQRSGRQHRGVARFFRGAAAAGDGGDHPQAGVLGGQAQQRTAHAAGGAVDDQA